MKAVYGTFEFEPWEADVQVFEEVMQSPRGFKLFRNQRIIFSGEICAGTQADIITRLGEIKTAFSASGQSCGLLDDSDTPVPGHWMESSADNSANVSDVQIVATRFPETKDGEFVSGRQFQIVVASLYKEPHSQIYEYRDSLERHGNAGAEVEWIRDKDWGWFPRVVSPTTLQRIVHEGKAVGVDNYLLPPDPLYPFPYEQLHQRMVTHIGPDNFPEGYAKFTTIWRYVYLLPTFDDISQPGIPV